MKRIKIYTFYSKSHQEIYENYFFKSFNENKLDMNFEIIPTEVIQRSQTGDFNSSGFNQTMNDKVQIIKGALESEDIFIYADCDIQFLENFYDDISQYISEDIDIVAQQDLGTICAGFMVIRSNERTKNLFNLISQKNYDYNDQIYINQHKNMVKYRLLPADKYFTIGNANGGRVWNGETNIKLPQNILVHHANFTIGKENKIKLFEMIKNNK